MSDDWETTVLKDDGRYQLVKSSRDDRLAVAGTRIAALREALARLTGASGSDHLAEGCACFHIAEAALRADDEAARG